ncbi:MAG: c-type cytochrome [Telluria sp.]
MSEIFTARNRWFTGSVAALVVIAVVAALVGFVWLPRAYGTGTGGLWDAICSAAGAPGRFENAALPEDKAAYPTSVVVSADMMGQVTPQQVGHGATLALACSMCHGAQGTSPAGTPHLAGQQASSLYKQLRDFQSGHRQSVIMQPMVANLSDQDMRDLAAYYASQKRDTPQPDRISPATPRLVRDGDPMRNVGACASCHSPNVQRPATPTLDGMNQDYLRAQLQAFHAGTRANDINRQMRNASHQLTAQEIDTLARYYASR